uniref:Uncharacterized protein n=1 Tax=Timema shepardi TaxID=629360 RepID=A0A7R9B345_TIMSH|nr:unnamed protein product [Timema shepardi]
MQEVGGRCCDSGKPHFLRESGEGNESGLTIGNHFSHYRLSGRRESFILRVSFLVSDAERRTADTLSQIPVSMLIRAFANYVNAFLLLSGFLTAYNMSHEMKIKGYIDLKRRYLARFIRKVRAESVAITSESISKKVRSNSNVNRTWDIKQGTSLHEGTGGHGVLDVVLIFNHITSLKKEVLSMKEPLAMEGGVLILNHITSLKKEALSMKEPVAMDCNLVTTKLGMTVTLTYAVPVDSLGMDFKTRDTLRNTHYIQLNWCSRLTTGCAKRSPLPPFARQENK